MIEDLGIDGVKRLMCEDCDSGDTCRVKNR
jgi:hypothetical protein